MFYSIISKDLKQEFKSEITEYDLSLANNGDVVIIFIDTSGRVFSYDKDIKDWYNILDKITNK